MNKTTEDRINEFKEFVNGTIITEQDIEWLTHNGFFTAPASTKYHLNYEGGLYEHSKHVADALLMYTKKLDLKWQRNDSPYIIGLLHDLCKIDQYIYDATKKQYIWNEKQLILGHGDKSVKYINDNLFELTEEEAECILHHMGAFNTDRAKWTDYTNAIHKYPNVLYSHMADIYATHIVEK